MADIHAERRDPAAPTEPIDLGRVGDELLDEARDMASGRAARTLTPGAHAPLKQTLVALREGVELSEHDTNGPATIHVLRGRATLPAVDGRALELGAGEWVVIPDVRHSLVAGEDCLALITVVPTA